MFTISITIEYCVINVHIRRFGVILILFYYSNNNIDWSGQDQDYQRLFISKCYLLCTYVTSTYVHTYVSSLSTLLKDKRKHHGTVDKILNQNNDFVNE